MANKGLKWQIRSNKAQVAKITFLKFLMRLSSENTFYKKIIINNTLLCFSQVSYNKIKAVSESGTGSLDYGATGPVKDP